MVISERFTTSKHYRKVNKMKTIIKIIAALAFVPVLVGCSSSSPEASSSDSESKLSCPFTEEQMKMDSADQKEIAEWREYANTGKTTERIKAQQIDRATAFLVVQTYDTAMTLCK